MRSEHRAYSLLVVLMLGVSAATARASGDFEGGIDDGALIRAIAASKSRYGSCATAKECGARLLEAMLPLNGALGSDRRIQAWYDAARRSVAAGPSAKIDAVVATELAALQALPISPRLHAQIKKYAAALLAYNFAASRALHRPAQSIDEIYDAYRREKVAELIAFTGADAAQKRSMAFSMSSSSDLFAAALAAAHP